ADAVPGASPLRDVTPPLPARRNGELLPVLRDRAASDVEPVFLELGGDLLVREGVRLVFLPDDVADLLLHGDDRLLLAVRPGRAAREEVLEGEDAAGRLHVLVGDGARDGRDVDADLVRD